LLEAKRILHVPHQVENSEAKKMLNWLKEKKIGETSARHLQQFGGFRDKEKRNNAIDTLLEHYYLRETTINDKSILQVNPLLFEM
jgi:hypothetical protein